MSGQVASDPKVTALSNSAVARVSFKMRSKVDGAWGRTNQKEYLRRYGTDVLIWVLQLSSSPQALVSKIPIGTMVLVTGSIDYWLSEMKTVDDQPISLPIFFVKGTQTEVLKSSSHKRMSNTVVTISKDAYDRVKDLIGDDGSIYSQEDVDKRMARLRELGNELGPEPV